MRNAHYMIWGFVVSFIILWCFLLSDIAGSFVYHQNTQNDSLIQEIKELLVMIHADPLSPEVQVIERKLNNLLEDLLVDNGTKSLPVDGQMTKHIVSELESSTSLPMKTVKNLPPIVGPGDIPIASNVPAFEDASSALNPGGKVSMPTSTGGGGGETNSAKFHIDDDDENLPIGNRNPPFLESKPGFQHLARPMPVMPKGSDSRSIGGATIDTGSFYKKSEGVTAEDSKFFFFFLQ
jgi:hypothetical protein